MFLLPLLMKLAMGAVMIAVTVVIHAVMCDKVFIFIENHARGYALKFKSFWKIWALIVSIFMIGAAIMMDIWLWTILFYFLEPHILGNIENALYFTTITFTTVGYGDVVLPPEWRLLSSSTAINGMIIFGWSTAFIFEIMSALYRPSERNWIRSDRHERHNHDDKRHD